MHKSNRIIGAGTVIAMLLAVPAMAQTSGPLTPGGASGISGATGLSDGTLAAIGAGALAVAAIATIASQSGDNAPAPTSTATTS